METDETKSGDSRLEMLETCNKIAAQIRALDEQLYGLMAFAPFMSKEELRQLRSDFKREKEFLRAEIERVSKEWGRSHGD